MLACEHCARRGLRKTSTFALFYSRFLEAMGRGQGSYDYSLAEEVKG
jgi:hypothetical protein